MKTVSVKQADVKKKWVVVDANGQTLGRLATEIARVLRGKHKPTFTPHLDCGDNVAVINAAKIKLTGLKWKNKMYYTHSGWVGGIYGTSARDLLAKHPERLIDIAVRGMLPKTKLGRRIATHFRVFADDKHDLQAQKPEPMPVRTAQGVK